MKISVIVPVYNTGEILKKTVNSILSQTYPDYELLLIDDGSTDKTGDICDEYSKYDQRVRTYHKKNGGICDARNFGIEKSTGKYITFCDHDDIYEPDILEKEIYSIEKFGADAVVTGKENLSENGSDILGINFCYTQKEVSEHFFDLNSNEIFNTIWNILYKRELIGQHRFDTTFTRGHEDINFNLDVLLDAKIVCGISDCLYHHIKHANSSTSAGLYRELIPKLSYISNKIYNIAMNLNLDEHSKKQYIIAQGEKIKTTLLYALKCNVTYDEFCKIFDDLNYIDFNTRITECIKNKCALFYWIRKKHITWLTYYAIKPLEQKHK